MKKREYIEGPTKLDESWWSAVLKDAETRFEPESRPDHEFDDQQSQNNGKQASEQCNWEWATQVFEKDQIISLEVNAHNRGGLLVNGKGIKGFVPASHLIASPKKNRSKLFESYLGRQIELKVIECDPEQGRLILSERAAQTDAGSRLELLNNLKEGDCVSGHVTTITKFGAFVDLGGVEGLIHISELSWGRVCHPKEVVDCGDEVEVCVLKTDRERCRVALSLKRLNPNPWDSVQDRYQTGQITSAEITTIVPYGAFARLEKGLDGLIHISEFNNLKEGNTIRDVLEEGQKVQVCILHVDPERQRLGLSLHEDGRGLT